MPNIVKLLRSTAAGVTPSALVSGQIAINEADGRLFWLDANGVTIRSVTLKDLDAAVSGKLSAASNLSDLANTATARSSLGLGSIATQSAAAYLAATNNLSDLSDAATARTNLGLGAMATQPASGYLAAANNLSDVGNAATARANLSITPEVSVRQTVSTGPVTTAGLPSLFPATSAALSITTQNVSTTAPFIATAASGFSQYGNVDAIWRETANISWTGLSASSTNYLYINASTGVVGRTTLAPIYQLGGTPAVTNGQFTFNIAQMKGYLGNGSAAVETPIVFVGEAVTNATTVTSSVTYAYNAFYDSDWTQNLPGNSTLTSKNSNIGISPQFPTLIFQCTTANAGYSVGDNIVLLTGGGSQYQSATPIGSTRNTVFFTAGSAIAFRPLHKTSGDQATLTSTAWKWKIISGRGW
jgi:hypothetical protein